MLKIPAVLTMCLAGGLVWGQQAPPPPQQQPAPQGADQRGPGPRGRMGQPRLGGKWWDNPEIAKRIGITADQQKKMDDVFQQSRLKLIDLTASLQKEEVVMEGLMQGPQLDDSKILPVADRIALGRAELEKANVRLLLGIRHVLTPEQWTKLETESPNGPRPSAGHGRPMGGNAGGPPMRPFEEE